MNTLHVLWGMVWARMATGAAQWQCAPPVKRRSSTLARAAITCRSYRGAAVGSRDAILMLLVYYCHTDSTN
eukprot:6199558-Pleurochrysis_carterae.AAC.2